MIDERILEYLDHNGSGLPEFMANLMPASVTRVRARCRILAEAELIAPEVPRGRVYVITNWGLAFLDKRIDAGHQPRPRQGTLGRG